MDGSIRSRAGSSPASRGLCWRWAAASAGGLALGLPLALALLDPLTLIVGMMLVTPVVFGIAGAILGTSQWIALRRLARASLWIALSAAGLGLGITAGVVTVEQIGRLVSGGQVRAAAASPLGLAASFLGIGVVSGLVLGAAQWVYLRRWFEGGGRWIGWSTAGMALGMLAGGLAAELLLGGFPSLGGGIVAFGITAVTLGLVTGRALERYARDAAASFRLAESS